VLDAGGVERRERLVEEPQRPAHDGQPRQRRAPVLAGRKLPAWAVRDSAELELAQGAAHAGGRQVLEGAPVREVFVGRKRAVQAVAMADPVAGLRVGRARDRALLRLAQAAQHFQQRSLSGAVGAADVQHLALLDAARKPAQQDAVAAGDGEVLELEQGGHKSGGARGRTRTYTALRPQDFKSRATTDSATRAAAHNSR
jgi:hypothetical protein